MIGNGKHPVRFDVYLANLNPTVGSEIKKRRPCVIISPDNMNRSLKTVIIAPMTSKGFDYPARVKIQFNDKTSLILLDQIRTVDKSRLGKYCGAITYREAQQVINQLQKMFAE
ncbi:MAG: type II toxin-antitoxin system PemK/MazF family toxin [Gammaproteobacteria bacterium]